MHGWIDYYAVADKNVYSLLRVENKTTRYGLHMTSAVVFVISVYHAEVTIAPYFKRSVTVLIVLELGFDGPDSEMYTYDLQ